jgi:hypothetical protein
MESIVETKAITLLEFVKGMSGTICQVRSAALSSLELLPLTPNEVLQCSRRPSSNNALGVLRSFMC